MVCQGKLSPHNSLPFHMSMCVRYMRYGSFGDLAILKNVSKIILYGDLKSFSPLSRKIILLGFVSSKVFVFCILVKYLSRPGLCYGLWRSATLSETVCVWRIQMIPDTTDMCTPFTWTVVEIQRGQMAIFFVAQKNCKTYPVSCELYELWL